MGNISGCNQKVAYNENIWVGVGNSPNKMSYSTNGTNWSTIPSSFVFSTMGISIECGKYNNQDLWISGGYNPLGALAYSNNGYNWTGMGTSVIDIYVRDIAYSYSQQIWVMVGSGTTHTIAYSSNGFK
jgi:hypothetical protein